MEEIKIRRTNANDLKEIVAMIQELADFEDMSDYPKLTESDLLRDGNFDGLNPNPLFNSHVAEIVKENDQKLIAGYTISYFTYSTWQGKVFFLEDIYVKPDYRKMGVGKKLFIENVKFAKQHKSVRFDFHVLDWNPAKKFYESLGAFNLTRGQKKEGWELYRLEYSGMEDLLERESTDL